MICRLQVSAEDAARTFGVNEHKVKGLQERAGWHAGMLASFCERMDHETMDWTIMSRLLTSIQVPRQPHGLICDGSVSSLAPEARISSTTSCKVSTVGNLSTGMTC